MPTQYWHFPSFTSFGSTTDPFYSTVTVLKRVILFNNHTNFARTLRYVHNLSCFFRADHKKYRSDAAFGFTQEKHVLFTSHTQPATNTAFIMASCSPYALHKSTASWTKDVHDWRHPLTRQRVNLTQRLVNVGVNTGSKSAKNRPPHSLHTPRTINQYISCKILLCNKEW